MEPSSITSTCVTVRAVLEQPARRVGQGVVSGGDGCRELDVIALIRRAGRPLRTAVDADHHVRVELGDRLDDLGAQFRGVADLAVREIPEPDVGDADDGRRPPLLAAHAAGRPVRARFPRCRPRRGWRARSGRSCPRRSTSPPPRRSRIRDRRDAAPAPARCASRTGTADQPRLLCHHTVDDDGSGLLHPVVIERLRRAAAASAASWRRRSPRPADPGRRRRAPRRARPRRPTGCAPRRTRR